MMIVSTLRSMSLFLSVRDWKVSNYQSTSVCVCGLCVCVDSADVTYRLNAIHRLAPINEGGNGSVQSLRDYRLRLCVCVCNVYVAIESREF